MQTHDTMTISLLRQHDVVMSFWRNNDVIITPCAHWVQLGVCSYGFKILVSPASKQDLIAVMRAGSLEKVALSSSKFAHSILFYIYSILFYSILKHFSIEFE